LPSSKKKTLATEFFPLTGKMRGGWGEQNIIRGAGVLGSRVYVIPQLSWQIHFLRRKLFWGKIFLQAHAQSFTLHKHTYIHTYIHYMHIHTLYAYIKYIHMYSIYIYIH
jgi:hypothetical protein